MAYTYKDAGVDVEAGYKAVSLMKEHAASTFDKNVLQGLGSFGGMYDNGDSVLVSGTDGVGTKLKAAFAFGKHDTVGIDCVAMCVNDIICHGAKPMFFLDYIAMGKLDPNVAADIVSGVAEGCRQAGCSLIGGETAEMPGFYQDGEYDMAGFCVGSVDKKKLVNGNIIIKRWILRAALLWILPIISTKRTMIKKNIFTADIQRRKNAAERFAYMRCEVEQLPASTVSSL